MQKKDYDGSQDYHIQFVTATSTAYVVFNPRCQYCGLSLKRKEFETIERDHVRSSPTYGSIIAKHYTCPDCKVPTEYRTTDLARALHRLSKEMYSYDGPTFNIKMDPFMIVEEDDKDRDNL